MAFNDSVIGLHQWCINQIARSRSARFKPWLQARPDTDTWISHLITDNIINNFIRSENLSMNAYTVHIFKIIQFYECPFGECASKVVGLASVSVPGDFSLPPTASPPGVEKREIPEETTSAQLWRARTQYEPGFEPRPRGESSGSVQRQHLTLSWESCVNRCSELTLSSHLWGRGFESRSYVSFLPVRAEQKWFPRGSPVSSTPGDWQLWQTKVTRHWAHWPGRPLGRTFAERTFIKLYNVWKYVELCMRFLTSSLILIKYYYIILSVIKSKSTYRYRVSPATRFEFADRDLANLIGCIIGCRPMSGVVKCIFWQHN